jgi:hypothetical protein
MPYYNQLFSSPRHIPNSSPDYWALHLIGAFYESGLGLGISLNSTCYVFGTKIIQSVNTHNQVVENFASNPSNGITNSTDYIEFFSITPAIVVPWVTLHEIGHCFGLEHADDITEDFSPRVMQQPCNFVQLAFNPNGIFFL